MVIRFPFAKIVVTQTNSLVLADIKTEIAALTAVNTLVVAKVVDDLILKNGSCKVAVGNDTRSAQRGNTQSLQKLEKEVKDTVKDFLTYINTSFGLTDEQKLRLAKDLGLASEEKSKSKKINNMDMLNCFSANIAENTAELIKGGIPQSVITAFTTFANNYINAATTQSGSKAFTRKMTVEENQELFDVTKKVKDLCLLAQRVFRTNPTKAALFDYNKRARSFMATTKKTTVTPTLETDNKKIIE